MVPGPGQFLFLRCNLFTVGLVLCSAPGCWAVGRMSFAADKEDSSPWSTSSKTAENWRRPLCISRVQASVCAAMMQSMQSCSGTREGSSKRTAPALLSDHWMDSSAGLAASSFSLVSLF